MNELSSSFHFSRLSKGDIQAVSTARHEHYLFPHLNLRSGMHILDFGCGDGSTALELAEFAGVSVVGVDPDMLKIEKAKQTARKRRLSNRVTFIYGDYSNLRSLFGDCYFDGIYCIESLKVFQLAVYEWCWTSEMNPDDMNHQRLAALLETSTGIGNRPISERSYEGAIEALQMSHLQIVHEEDLSTRSGRAVIPWYACLDLAFSDPRIRWSSSIGGQGAFGGLTKSAAVIMSQAGHLKPFTPMALFVAKRVMPEST
ncbi:hypothetical protein EW145_g2714 [Phellinidium pouzarii]|uniref:Methyltransferase domain-containing protein n=1 Tax=Phellinidium pouzarii TaxID=167371 RepID=A0A4S4LA96_9AGAM|nr:hypothetical protein EW145_g2714 [Phellinidium pouzarii]